MAKEDRETRERLLESARLEFMEKGYMKASLRSICKNAGVTTGALYFFFQDKEDLFAALVEEPLSQLHQVMEEHYEQERQEAVFAQHDYAEDMQAAKEVIHYLYQHYDAFLLLLTKAQGSRFECCVDRFVDITEKHYRQISDQMSEQLQLPRLENYLIHWISHMHIDVFTHMLTHEESEQAALQSMDGIVRYLTTGWMGLFQK